MSMEDVHKHIFLPEHFHIHDLSQQYPQATMLMTHRPKNKWLQDINRFFDLKARLLTQFQINVTDYPGGADQALLDLYDNHTQEMRQFAKQNPNHALIEIEVEQDDTAQQMATIFGGDISCWPDGPLQ
mmetsp:Transcript_5828/g.12973  ORF Transcript_5828/g.12973 Transcript_5828/m.12973 type:complete len:128 (+) Transcript_5828:2-385(+)